MSRPVPHAVKERGLAKPYMECNLHPLPLPTVTQTPCPAVFWIHGGAFLAGSRTNTPWLAIPLLTQGIAVVSVDYRLSWQAIFPAQINDCKAAIRFIRAHASDYHIDPDRLGAWGSSAGGHLAAMVTLAGDVPELEGTVGSNLACSSSVLAGVDYFGPSDLLNLNPDVTNPPGSTLDHDAYNSPESRLIGFDQPGQGIGVLRANLTNPLPPFPEKVALALAASPVTHARSNDPPLLIAHGQLDTTIPWPQSTRLYNVITGVDGTAELRLVPTAGHGNLGPATAEEARAFLYAHLVPEPVAALACAIAAVLWARRLP